MNLIAQVAASFLIFSSAFSASEDVPYIETVEGEKIVIVKSGGKTRVATIGSAVEIGETIKTGPRTSVKVRYPDGSKLLIGRSTEMEVTEPVEKMKSAEVRSGQIRALIKSKLKEKQKSRFLFRTKTVALGVRGTDFIFESAKNSDKSSVHTLSGAVEVAEDEQTLLSGYGKLVQKGQFVEAKGEDLSEPEKFDVDKYNKDLKKVQPTFYSLVAGDAEIREIMNQQHQKINNQNQRIKLFNFQFAGASGHLLSENNNGLAGKFGFHAAWSPYFSITPSVAIRGHLGATPILAEGSDRAPIVFETGGLVSFTFKRYFMVEAGAGLAGVWYRIGEPAGFAMVNLAFRQSYTQLLERVFIGVSYYNGRKPRTIQFLQINAGIGINL